MSISLSAQDIQSSITERQTRVLSWESNFEKNHKNFADNIAHAIAKQIKDEFLERIKNPYKPLISSKIKFSSRIPFSITKSLASRKLIKLIVGSEDLPPFNEWLAKFSSEPELPYLEEDHDRFDRKYFEDLMSIVGRLAEEKLKLIFSDFTSNSDYKDLQCEACYIQSSSMSDYKDYYLLIQLWFNENIIPKQVEGKSSGVINQNRVKQKQLQKKHRMNTIILVAVVAIIAVTIFKTGIFNKLQF